jgi:hypothetical protein
MHKVLTRPPTRLRNGQHAIKAQLSLEANFFNQQGEVEQILEEAAPLATVESKKPN